MAVADGKPLIDVVRDLSKGEIGDGTVDWQALGKPENYVGESNRMLDRVLESANKVFSLREFYFTKMSNTAKADKVVSMREAIATHVADDCSIAIEGFTGFICFAAGHEIIRQRRRNLTLIRMTPDLIYDQMIAAGAA